MRDICVDTGRPIPGRDDSLEPALGQQTLLPPTSCSRAAARAVVTMPRGESQRQSPLSRRRPAVNAGLLTPGQNLATSGNPAITRAASPHGRQLQTAPDALAGSPIQLSLASVMIVAGDTRRRPRQRALHATLLNTAR